MNRELPATTVGPSSHPELEVGQPVRILRGEHRGINGRVVACEWDDSQNDWGYFVKAGKVEYGPYTAKELW